MNKLLKVEPLDTAVEVTQENQAPQGRCTELQERILETGKIVDGFEGTVNQAMAGEPRGFSRVAAGFSNYDGNSGFLLCCPREVHSSIRGARESRGLLSSHFRANETSSMLVFPARILGWLAVSSSRGSS